MTDLEINEAFGKPMYEADPTNARYNSLQLQCYEQRKEIDRLNEHITELENRLRALWDKLEGERKFYDQRISHLESWINSLDEVLRYNGKDGQREWCGSEVGYLYPGQRVYVGGDKP